MNIKLIGALAALTIAASNTLPQSSAENIPLSWKTTAESSNYQTTPRYDETILFARRLDAGSDLIVYKSFGKSSEGRDLPLLIAAKNKAFTPASARRQGKAVILVQAAIHAGEPDGKDAGLALLRDIAILKTRQDLLNDVVILFVPIYNVDGHELFSKYNRINQNGPEEMGFRANSANQNLNRDYLKADTPETAAWLSLWEEWNPDFFIDCHVTDGADFRYNLTYEFAHHADAALQLVEWMNKIFETGVVKKVESHGNLISKYLQFADQGDPTKGVFSFIATPRFATGYTPLKNRIGLLIEAHSLKSYESRVRGTYDLLRYTIEAVGENKKSLKEANQRADQETITRGKSFDNGRKFPLQFRIGSKSTPFAFKGLEVELEESGISGTKRIIYGNNPLDLVIPKYDEAVITASVAPPLYYIVPPQWVEVVERLDRHHITYKRIENSREFAVESYRIDDPKWAGAPFEGRLTMSFKAVPVKQNRTYPKNSLIIPLSQKNANVAIHMLEPDSPDSLLFWGFFNAIFEQKEYSESYIMEDIARQMLADDQKLSTEFNERLKDPEFANNPRARLNFFYKRSPYFDQRIGFYPVGRITERILF